MFAAYRERLNESGFNDFANGVGAWAGEVDRVSSVSSGDGTRFAEVWPIIAVQVQIDVDTRRARLPRIKQSVAVVVAEFGSGDVRTTRVKPKLTPEAPAASATLADREVGMVAANRGGVTAMMLNVPGAIDSV